MIKQYLEMDGAAEQPITNISVTVINLFYLHTCQSSMVCKAVLSDCIYVCVCVCGR